ncbi:DUF4367 domain-containing protein [Paenibacillus profundus]|uniref:DUF4367 domain-containing protein n=1 Tax=Paenibacillus profundus TaxID=1173085 RepID=A0ABS8YHD0_9BACL|nr:DUF4367 domain-containing protein [Paenibacillus profundus]MCE5169770.1 DUF4367 domain-containing protein [Paenibacillus profundus]
MRKSRQTLEDVKIKDYLIDDGQESSDVSQRVMERIHALHELRNGKRPVRYRKKAVVVIICIIIALTSITGYAASRYVQIMNQKGEIIVETKEIREDPYAPHTKKWRELLSAYTERVQEQLKPGELVAYYVHDKTINAYDTANKVKTEFKPIVHASYAAFANQLEKMSGPQFMEPKYLPEGFAFESGNVFPSATEGEASWAHLKKLEPEFIREAETTASGAKLFIKPLIWNKAGSATVRYTNGTDTLIMNAYERKNSNSPVKTMHPNGVTAEKLTVSGQDMIYMEPSADAAGSVRYKHKLEWLDVQAEVYYSIFDNSESELSKSEFIRIVKSMIAK